MVELRHHQRRVWEGWFPEEAEGWWEQWMKQADPVLLHTAAIHKTTDAARAQCPQAKQRTRLRSSFS